MDKKENTAAGGNREPCYVEITRFYREVPVNERGRTKQQERNTDEISKILAEKFKTYKKECRKAGIK